MLKYTHHTERRARCTKIIQSTVIVSNVMSIIPHDKQKLRGKNEQNRTE